jgi:hypothetical protein
MAAVAISASMGRQEEQYRIVRAGGEILEELKDAFLR